MLSFTDKQQVILRVAKRFCKTHYPNFCVDDLTNSVWASGRLASDTCEEHVYVSATNSCIDHIRRKHNWPFLTREVNEYGFEIPDQTLETREHVAYVLRKLPKAHRRLLVYHYLKDRSWQFIVDRLGLRNRNHFYRLRTEAIRLFRKAY